MDLESFLITLYVMVDDWWQQRHSRKVCRPGRPTILADSEVLTLAILSQWSRFRSERDFWRFADAHLRRYFPNLLSQGQLNRLIRALEPQLGALQRDLAQTLAEPTTVYHVLDKGKDFVRRIVKQCAGLDVHKASVTACVRVDTFSESGEEPYYQETRKFSSTTEEGSWSLGTG